MKAKINTFDIDGVIYFGPETTGVRPGIHDICITGRSITQQEETETMLRERGIYNPVLYNPLRRDDPEYSRAASGRHKAAMITKLKRHYSIGLHFEDDPIQIEEIRKVHPDLTIIHMVREDEKLVEY